jgi:ribosomal protein S6
MAETRVYAYEGMFLFPQTVAADLQGAADHVLEMLSKGEAEIVSMCKWDERRLAYDIKGNKRGVYVLAFFRVLSTKLAGIELDRKIMADLAMHQPESFKAIIAQVQAALDAKVAA